LNQGLVESMDIDAWVIQPSLYPTLNTLGEYPSTGHMSNPFGQIHAACVNDRYHQPDTGGQMAQMGPISRLTEPVRQGMVEGRVFLSILVDEWFLIPECWLSLGLVNSHSPQHLSTLP
jgi:hypothetical protein